MYHVDACLPFCCWPIKVGVLHVTGAICGFLRSVEKTIKNSYLFIIKILFYSGLKSRS